MVCPTWPTNPTVGDTVQRGNVTYQWTGVVWDSITGPLTASQITGAIRSFDTVADMQASADLSPGDSLETKDITAKYLFKTFAQATADGDFYSATSTGNIQCVNGVAVLCNFDGDLLRYGASATVDSSAPILEALTYGKGKLVKAPDIGTDTVEFTGNMTLPNTPLTIMGAGLGTGFSVANTEQSNGLYLPAGGRDIVLDSFSMTSTPSLEPTQAITLVNCVNVTIRDITVTGFTQFPVSLRLTVSQAYGNYSIKNLNVIDGGLAGVGVSNAFEIFAGGANGFIDDLVVEDSSFSIGTGKGGNIAKFGVSTTAYIVRCNFNALNRTGESVSSGVEAGSASNNKVDTITFEDCKFNDVGQTTGLYGFASRCQFTTLKNCVFPTGNSIFVPDDVEELILEGGKVSAMLFNSVTMSKLHITDTEFDQTLALTNITCEDIVLTGVKGTTLTLGVGPTSNITLIDCGFDIINTTGATNFGSVTIRGKAPRQLVLNQGTISDIDVAYAAFEVADLTHFLKSTNLMELHHNTFKAASNNPTATNMVQIDSNARFTHNYVADVNRTFHVTVANGATLEASLNTHYDSVDNNVYGVISGTVAAVNNVINNTLV